MRAAVPFESTEVRPFDGQRVQPRPEVAFPTDDITESISANSLPSPRPAEPKPPRPSPAASVAPLPPVIPLPAETPLPPTPKPAALATALPAETPPTDGWPVPWLGGPDAGYPADEMTRIGVPAYEASAKLITEATGVAPPAPPALRPFQALRVVVWRAHDGVHVAPAGTRVGAITVEAMLVALDPAADLASWLSNK